MRTDLNIQVEQITHPGKVRRENQDRMGRFSCPLGEVFVIADGMGGREGGAAAAMLAIARMQVQLNAATPQSGIKETLERAALRVNEEILAAAAGNPRTSRMGTTMVLGVVQGGQVTIGHVGDSRAYLFQSGRLRRLTHDHSLVQRMMDHPMLTEEEARVHPDSSVVTRWLGQPGGFELQVTGPVAVGDGDALLLCSDGLCRGVDDAALEELLRRGGGDPKMLLDAALEQGGEDNITLQLIRFATASGKRSGRVAVQVG
jgi:protein phosphatase